MVSTQRIEELIMQCSTLQKISDIVKQDVSILLSDSVCKCIRLRNRQLIESLCENGNVPQIDPSLINAYTSLFYEIQRRHRANGRTPNGMYIHILRDYVRDIMELSHGGCLSILARPYEDIKDVYDQPAPLCFEHIGIIFLCFEFTPDKMCASDLHAANFLFTQAHLLAGFIRVLCDCNSAMYYLGINADWAAQKIVAMTSDGPSHRYPSVIDRLLKPDFTFIASMARVSEGESESNEEDVEDMCTIYAELSNALFNSDLKFDYMTSYIEVLHSPQLYPETFSAVEGRYQKYFGDMTEEYIFDISAVLHILQRSLVNGVISQQNVVDTCTEAINRFILVLMGIHPHTDQTMLHQFAHDIAIAYPYRPDNLSASITMLYDLIDTSLKKYYSAVGMESDTSYIGTESEINLFDAYYDLDVIAMEADDAGNGDDDGGSSLDTSSLHRKAKVRTNDVKQAASRKLHAGWKKYKETEEAVDQSLVKVCDTVKKAVTGDQNKILVEGKKFSPIGLLKKVILTIGVFNYSKVALMLGFIVGKVMKGKARRSEKRKLMQQLTEELTLVEEKISDASSDGNREAKYALMRTKAALENAIQRLKFGMNAEEASPDRLSSAQTGYQG